MIQTKGPGSLNITPPFMDKILVVVINGMENLILGQEKKVEEKWVLRRN